MLIALTIPLSQTNDTECTLQFLMDFLGINLLPSLMGNLLAFLQRNRLPKSLIFDSQEAIYSTKPRRPISWKSILRRANLMK
ncbi:MAG TPA: hypothetical protein DD400_02735 [Rhodospirillaceae bacterium]|nr:hypothetical protein [Rhodospirillaceae bacterium]